MKRQKGHREMLGNRRDRDRSIRMVGVDGAALEILLFAYGPTRCIGI